MAVVELTIDHFLWYTTKNPSDQYAFKGRIWSWLYSFYKEVSQINSYLVVVDSLDQIPREMLESRTMFQQYGIYFQETPSDAVFSREYLLVLSKEDIQSEEGVRRKFQEVGTELTIEGKVRNPKITACLIEKNFSGADAAKAWAAMCSVVSAVLDPAINICNSSLYATHSVANIYKQSSLQRYKEKFGAHFDFVNLEHVFVQSGLTKQVTSDDTRYNMVRWIFSALKEFVAETQKKNSNTLFYYEVTQPENAIKLYNTLYLEFVAYWVVVNDSNNPFVVEGTDLPEFYKALNAFRTQKFMYCDEWLLSLVNPLDYGFYSHGKSGQIDMLCTRDFKDDCGERVRFSVQYVAFNPETRSIGGNKVFRNTFKFNEIQVFSLQELYGLSSKDREQALQGLQAINDLTKRLECVLYPHGYNQTSILDDLLTCSNILLFKHNNSFWLGAVTSVQATYHYFVRPLLQGADTFRMEFRLTDLDNLYPLAVFADAGSVAEVLPRLEDLMEQEELTSTYNTDRTYLEGIMLKEVSSADHLLLSECEYSVEELGFWAPQPQEFRVHVDSELLSFLSPRSARECSILTYFGGPHPLLCTKFTLMESHFRR